MHINLNSYVKSCAGLHACFPFRLHFQVCICSAHKSLFVPILCVCSFIPASVEPRAHLARMRAAASRCLSLIHGRWTASAAIPLPPFYITYLSKKHSAYLPAPTALPPTGKLYRDATFLWVGKIFQKIFYICLSIWIAKSLLVRHMGLALQSHLFFPSPFAFSQGSTILPQIPQTLRATPLWKWCVRKLQQTFLCVLFFLSLPLNSLCILITHFLSVVFSAFTLANVTQPQIQGCQFVLRLLDKPHCIGCATLGQFCCTICSHEALINSHICTYRHSPVSPTATRHRAQEKTKAHK